MGSRCVAGGVEQATRTSASQANLTAHIIGPRTRESNFTAPLSAPAWLSARDSFSARDYFAARDSSSARDYFAAQHSSSARDYFAAQHSSSARDWFSAARWFSARPRRA